MKALKFLQTLKNSTSKPPKTLTILSRFISSQTLEQTPGSESEEPHDTHNNIGSSFGFDSSEYELPNMNSGLGIGLGSSETDTHVGNREATWDEKYRRKVNKTLFGEEHEKFVKEKKNKKKGKTKNERMIEQEEKRRRTVILSKALLEAAVAENDEIESEDDDEVVKVEDQLSLSVGIIGAPNAGKSALTNFMVCLNLTGFVKCCIFECF